MQIHTRTKRKRAHARHNVRAPIFALCPYEITQKFMQIVLIVHCYVMTLSFKFRMDPSICCGVILKIMLNMHARGIHKFAKFRHMCMHYFALCVCIGAHIFTKFCLVVYYSVMNISFKFHKDLTLQGYSQNWAMLFFGQHCMSIEFIEKQNNNFLL